MLKYIINHFDNTVKKFLPAQNTSQAQKSGFNYVFLSIVTPDNIENQTFL